MTCEEFRKLANMDRALQESSLWLLFTCVDHPWHSWSVNVIGA